MPLTLPGPIQDKIATMPETGYGVNRVTLVLKNGRLISEVAVAWTKDIVKVGGSAVRNTSDLDFDIRDVMDVQR
jgi:hypothetical protein